ncbi:hypothetical protein [Paenibacillus massiliensis]|uniref:hypothetical protein n=1 Tax=Paenibacillus massiliensis TaxID=225917 RepID=UPI0003F74ADA|nr:hypothetical protein [Paenibacillus massiliensis]
MKLKSKLMILFSLTVVLAASSQQIDAVSSATKDLDANAGRIADVISGVASMSEQSAASTEEVASSTQEQFNYITSITERSKELTEHADMLLQEVNKFKI